MNPNEVKDIKMRKIKYEFEKFGTEVFGRMEVRMSKPCG
jgi:hypothetical protein